VFVRHPSLPLLLLLLLVPDPQRLITFMYELIPGLRSNKLLTSWQSTSSF
jgi:hypothetical protein